MARKSLLRTEDWGLGIRDDRKLSSSIPVQSGTDNELAANSLICLFPTRIKGEFSRSLDDTSICLILKHYSAFSDNRVHGMQCVHLLLSSHTMLYWDQIAAMALEAIIRIRESSQGLCD
jgi:hypothetical protein